VYVQKSALECVLRKVGTAKVTSQVRVQLAFVPINQLREQFTIAGLAIPQQQLLVGQRVGLGVKLASGVAVQIVNGGLHRYIRTCGQPGLAEFPENLPIFPERIVKSGLLTSACISFHKKPLDFASAGPVGLAGLADPCSFHRRSPD
jgi:hypothetical protein